MGKNVTDKQKANLIPFTEKTAREMGARGGKKKKENEPKRKAKEEIKQEIIQETYGQVYERLKNGTLSNDELLKLFGSVVKISGDLIQKQEISNTTPLIVVEDEKHRQMLENL